MKIDTRKDCRQMSAQDCFLLNNNAIPESSASNDDTQALLGREVLYEPIVIHSPVLVSTRLQDKANKVRLSKKHIRRMNDMMDEFAIHKLTDSVGGLLIRDRDNDEESEFHPPSQTQSSGPDDESREDAVTAVKSGNDVALSTTNIVEEETRSSSLGRVQIKILDEQSRKEIVVSRCVRFMDTEEAEI